MMLLLNLIAAAIVFVAGLRHANRMTRCTSHGIRLAWVVLTAGALSVLLGPLYGGAKPGWAQVLFNLGVAVFVIANRRGEVRQ